MKLIVDMNLSPRWVVFLGSHGFESHHWNELGDPGASDSELFAWAQQHGRTIFTHDLDFGRLLALTESGRPSVVQLRRRDVSPDAAGPILLSVLRQHRHEIEAGAIVTVEETGSRCRILPIR